MCPGVRTASSTKTEATCRARYIVHLGSAVLLGVDWTDEDVMHVGLVTKGPNLYLPSMARDRARSRRPYWTTGHTFPEPGGTSNSLFNSCHVLGRPCLHLRTAVSLASGQALPVANGCPQSQTKRYEIQLSDATKLPIRPWLAVKRPAAVDRLGNDSISYLCAHLRPVDLA